MQISAKKLGEEYGLNAQEMNAVLKKLGFLEGEPGNYVPTEKALPYVVEKSHHRGNEEDDNNDHRDWETRTFDDSIKNDLDITEELKAEVKEELAARRAAKRAANHDAAQAHSDTESLENHDAEKVDTAAEEQAPAAEEQAPATEEEAPAAEEQAPAAEEEAPEMADEQPEYLGRVRKFGLILVISGVLIYGVYKLLKGADKE